MSLGEIIRIALIDTALGMGTVFLILIFISVCIWLLGLVCGPEKEKKTEAEGPAAEPAADEGIRPEVVAAVTAAIHQHLSEEGMEEGYVVRNVRRATWRHTS
jgi:sodium pump decarboxylase gamma subunit